MKLTDHMRARLVEAGILETGEVVAFAIGLLEQVKEARSDDGKVSWVEGGKMALKSIGPSKEAFDNFTAIPGELKGINGEKVELLADILFPFIVDTQKPWTVQLVSRAIGVAVNLADGYSVLINRDSFENPPKAVVVVSVETVPQVPPVADPPSGPVAGTIIDGEEVR